MKHRMFRIIILLAGAFLVAGCTANLIYHPCGEVLRTPTDAGLAYEDVVIETSDGVRITGWWVPAADPRGTVLFCHGNGGNIADRLDTLVIAGRLNLNMLVFDYRGYGKSGGAPSEQGTYLDAKACYRYLVEEREIVPETIVIWGRSLGGAVAAGTAAEHPCGLLIIESSFTSLEDLVRERFGWIAACVLANYVYPVRSRLEQVDAPVLVIHSKDDEMIPFSHGRSLYDAARGKKAFLVIQGSHNRGFLDSLAVYESGVDDFITGSLEHKEAYRP